MRKLGLILLCSFLSVANNAGAAARVNIPHMGSLTFHIENIVNYIANQVFEHGCHSLANDVEFITADSITPYVAIGASDKYFSSVAVAPTTCNLKLTFKNTTIADFVGTPAPLPFAIQGAKIYLTAFLYEPYPPSYGGTCTTNIDDAYKPFKSAALTTVGASSVLARSAPNRLVWADGAGLFAQCKYNATPF